MAAINFRGFTISLDESDILDATIAPAAATRSAGGDPTAAAEIEMRLGAYGFDQQAINAGVYVQAREIFLFFESLLNAAQSRRLLLIREIKNHRCLSAAKPKL